RTTRFCAGPRFSSRGSSTPETADPRVHRRDESRRVCSRVDPPRPASAGPGDRCTNLPGLEETAPHRARTVTDALVEDKIRELAWTFNATTQRWQMTPEGLYGRRKWVALLRRQEGGRHLPWGRWTGRC